ncbi:heavy metal translocating P-type ATPase [Puniceibacterium sp. IMCC21224]|uniref:heavy metal translocating P-type ATPase n=1 Tax=Puniceibacterium sp. IMCC21224 TaxID=1618204 RepID=UPI00064D8AE1|nr:heavy metal translocating P-type ATPase [Puniceibacterium sp. IMCC21224]KMK67530.1 heavy metal-translocating P-type ATPase [Puniceibacterium sp. IMCC21224]
MSLVEQPGMVSCPGCAALPAEGVRDVAAPQVIDLALPGIHCAACIATVENGLQARPEVGNARVNLSQRRVRIHATGAASVEGLVDHLAGLGIAALPLDTATLGGPQDRAARALLMRVAVAGFAMMNVMLLSVAVWSGATDATRGMFHWISAAIALPAVAFCAQPFFANAWAALSARRLNMDVPISLAILLAVAMSLYETMMGGADAWFDAALSLTFFLLAGRWLDQRSRSAAQSAAARLTALEVPRVIRLIGAARETVALAEIAVGDRIAVLPGARVPVDGLVQEGRSDVDHSMLTGESLPMPCVPGDSLPAGALNGAGALTLGVTAVGEDSTLRRMASMIDAAESARNRYTALADRAAQIYAPLVHLLALAGFVGWMMLTGDMRHALGVAVAVLIITCPCALGLAVPAVSTAAAGVLFRRGVLVKNGTALERLAGIDTVVFDKTGTLTDGVLRLDVGQLPASAAQIALALAEGSTHPVARAVAQGLRARDVAPAALRNLTEYPGLGLGAETDAGQVRLGSAVWTAQASGTTSGTGPGVWLTTPSGAWYLTLDSNLREGAADTVAALQAAGIDLHLFSGDTPDAVAPVADALRIQAVRAGMSPAEKVAGLEALARDGRKVLMVGDGLNDAAALASAWASVSPGSATDLARVASDVVLLSHGLAELPVLLRVARKARARSVENFGIAAVYNMVAVPLALAGIATPLMAAIAMSASSISVLLNALRVRP